MTNYLQNMMDGLSQQWKEERSQTQMTLGKLIDRLESMKDIKIDAIKEPHSYRGYYSDLSFEKGDGKMKVSELLKICKDCMGEVFTGYKGGDYMMGRNTPVWIAYYSRCGDKIISLNDDGTWTTEEDNF